MTYNSGLPAIHPGEFLGEILTDLQVVPADFARAVDLAPEQLGQVLQGAEPVTAELALLFGRALDQSPHYWLNLQAEYDLKTAEAHIASRLARVRAIAQVGVSATP